MRKGKLVRVARISLVAALVPFAVIGLALTIGMLRDGPSYLLFAYDEIARRGHAKPLARLMRERSTEEFLAPRVIRTETPNGQALEDPARLTPLIEPLAPRRLPAAQTAQAIAELPAYDPVSAFGLELADLQGLAVDYVSLPANRSKYVTDDSPVRLRFRPSAGPRALVLAGQPGLSWWFEGDLSAAIVAVLVTAPEDDRGETLFGLPDSIPALRIDAGREELPFMLSALPDCAVTSNPRLPFDCSNLRRDRSRLYRTPFDAAEHRVRVLLGADIATVSGAFADDRDRIILVPEEIVDRAVRERARSYVARHDEATRAEARHREVLDDYARRWVEDRRAAVLEEIARHPPYLPARVVGEKPDVLIVSAHKGTSKARRTRMDERRIRTYRDFAEQKEVGTIVVEVSAREPTVVFATASAAVDWRFELAEGARVLAIHVEGTGAPRVTGVPRDIPLIVRSKAYGDHKVASQVMILKDPESTVGESERIREDLERIRDMYPGSALVIYSKYQLDRARLTN